MGENEADEKVQNNEQDEEKLQKLLYEKSYTCSLCRKKFTTLKPRHSKLKLIREHGDFYKEYEDINPSYYLVQVCRHCGYAYTDQFSKPNPSQQEKLNQQVVKNWTPRDFGSYRDAETALESLKLAILCGQIQGVKLNVLATLLLHTSWVYRDLEDVENEQRFITLARDYFLKIYQEDTSGEIDLVRLLYLLGELNRRLENYEEAVNWFSRLVSDKKIKDQKLISRARDQWTYIKKERKQKKNQE